MTSAPQRLFGTDGVRGIANRFPVESRVATAIGQAVALVFKETPGLNRIVLGKDTRLSGYVIEAALLSGICSMGMDAMLTGPLPTPGIAFIAHSMRAQAGVMVSASHNPLEYNGIKLFDHKGFKLPDSTERRIEELIASGTLDGQRAAPCEMGRAFRIDDASGRYIQYLKGTFPSALTLEGLKVVVDCANGAGYKVAPAVFRELGAEVVPTAVSPNGLNINCDCGALHPERMARLVREHGADLGVALDGDADRVIMCDEKGSIIDGDAILAICALDLKRHGGLPQDAVVGTSMSNMGLELSLREHGVKLLRTDVGDRYVMEAMRREGIVLGGEPSGHVIFLQQTTSGDGTLAALRVLTAMLKSGKPLSEVRRVFQPLPQALLNVPIREKAPVAGLAGVSAAIADAERKLAGRGRVLVRYSGTENIARVMVEGENDELIGRLAAGIASAFERELGQEG